jgi:hypothetical protein
MNLPTQLLSMTLAALIGFGSSAYAQALAAAQPPTSPPANKSARSTALWTSAGAGAGFGIGLSVGLKKYDDAINSDRKVWTSAVVGAAIGAAGGYLLARLRNKRSRSAPTAKYPDPKQRRVPNAAW